ncbi:hypothetical protein CBS101457_000664 [Exobasidium rhododendri]|nr:hypothetical protein CBS101457_000664 [Exobasidium rhododendri]
MAPRLLTGILFRPLRLLLVSLVLTFISTRILTHLNKQNPNSHFFDPDEETYASRVSSARKALGKEYIQSIKAPHGRATPTSQPDLGVVFVSVKRKKEQYLDAALGSFLREVTPAERDKMFISVNIGDFNPTNHPFYDSVWLHSLVDQVGVRMPIGKLHFPSLDAKEAARSAQVKITPIPVVDPQKSPLKTSTWHRKATLDYAFALDTCREIGAPYCLIIEDDTVFVSHWYSQVMGHLQRADHIASPDQWGYIRLFWAEKYFGWESEEVPNLILWCVVSMLVTAALLFGLCKFSPRSVWDKKKDRDYQQLSGRLRSELARVRLPLGSILILVAVVLGHAILFILSGRNHVYHVPKGLSRMPERGCCTQAIIYPLDIIRPLASHLLDRSGEKPYDIMINRWMESHQREKLAINPPVLQHIGEGSSRQMAEEYWRRTPLWSFAFEEMQNSQG